MTDVALGGKHLLPYSLYSTPSYRTVAQDLPHTQTALTAATQKLTEVEPPRLCEALQNTFGAVTVV